MSLTIISSKSNGTHVECAIDRPTLRTIVADAALTSNQPKDITAKLLATVDSETQIAVGAFEAISLNGESCGCPMVAAGLFDPDAADGNGDFTDPRLRERDYDSNGLPTPLGILFMEDYDEAVLSSLGNATETAVFDAVIRVVD